MIEMVMQTNNEQVCMIEILQTKVIKKKLKKLKKKSEFNVNNF